MDSTRDGSFYGGDSFSLQRNRVLPSAEDLYICLTDEELDFIGRSRLKQADEDEGYCASRSSSASSIMSSSPSASYFSREDLERTGPSFASREDLERTIPTSDKFYISLSDEEWEIKDCDHNEHHIHSNDTLYSITSTREKKVILPEPELSSTRFIPPHIEAFDEVYEATLGNSDTYAQQARIGKGPFGSYSAAMNTVNVVSMKAFGPNRTDSLFKYIFGKFRDQHRLK